MKRAAASSDTGYRPLILAGVAAIVVALMVAMALAAPTPAEPTARPIAQRYFGVNLASGEFGGKRSPARYGYDYMYPTAKIAAPFVAAGMTAVRVPVRWERLQRTPMAPLDATELARFDAALAQLGGFRMIIVDIHNYGAYRGVTLDRLPEGAAMLADLWSRLAAHYRANDQIAFGLMNEPHGIAATDWRRIAERSLRAIRTAGARNLVLVPGTNWSGAHTWVSSNGDAMAGLADPGDNMAFEMHQYLDADSTGTHSDCVSPDAATVRIAAATRWLRANHARGFLGEFSADPNPGCAGALDALLSALDSAPDAWLGWTYWAGGSMWGRYPKSVQPDAAGAKPQMEILLRHRPN